MCGISKQIAEHCADSENTLECPVCEKTEYILQNDINMYLYECTKCRVCLVLSDNELELEIL